MSQSYWMGIQTLAIFLTLGVLVKYTYETLMLRRETEKQTELSIRPFIVIEYDETEDSLKVANLGNGIAQNIKIDDIPLIDEVDFRLYYVFPEVNYLCPKEKRTYGSIKKRINGELSEADDFDLAALMPPTAQKSFDVTIRYKNIVNTEYKISGKLGAETFIFERIDRAIGQVAEGVPKELTKTTQKVLSFLKKRYPHPVYGTESITISSINSEELMKTLHFCYEVGFIEASPIKEDQKGIVDFRFIKISSKGMLFLEGP